MSATTFAVVFTGQVVEGADVEQVKASLARLFKVELARVASMFSGKPTAIKTGLDEATARKYQEVLRQAGALCQVIDMAAVRKPAAPAATPTAPRIPAPPTPPTKPAVQPTAPAPVLNATLAEPGVLLKEPEEVSPLQVDISRLRLGAAGETLVEAKPAVELQVDTSALSMAEPGAMLKEPEEVKALEIDTSKIRLA